MCVGGARASLAQMSIFGEALTPIGGEAMEWLAPRVTLKKDANLETLLKLAWPPPAIRQQDKALIGAALAVLRLDG